MVERKLLEDQVRWIKEYRAEVVTTFGRIFTDAGDRFADGDRLLRRFGDAVDLVLKGSSFRAVDEAHNELCIAKSLLDCTKPCLSSVAYEPRLPGYAKTIDFCAESVDLTVFVDVKTIKPEPKDRWEQLEEMTSKERLAENVHVVLLEEWLGGELWHGMFASRARMLEYTMELESKIRECGLTGLEKTTFVMALCGAGVDWHEDQLEDFVQFYRTGRHRSDDPLAKLEAHYIEEKKIALKRTVSQFAFMQRRQGEILPARVNWNVQSPRDLP